MRTQNIKITPILLKLTRTGVGYLRDFLLPPRCLVCRKRVLQEHCLCAHCWKDIGFIDHPLCPLTGAPFSRPWPPDMQSAQARIAPPHYDRARALMSYDSEKARALIARLKYGDAPEIAAPAARWLMRLAQPLLKTAHAIAPVPLHHRRLFWRRFNQAAEIAQEFSRQSGIRYVPDLLLRSGNNTTQKGLTRAQRRRNVASAFCCNPQRTAAIKGQSIILVDDVLTSGATSQQCASLLHKAGAKHVALLTLARVFHESDTHP